MCHKAGWRKNGRGRAIKISRFSLVQERKPGEGDRRKGVIAFLLAAMTLVTFVYVVLNNLYTPFYYLSDWLVDNQWPASAEVCVAMGDFFIGLAQEMTWSTALTKAIFAWLIFLGMSYGVRVGGHIGVVLECLRVPGEAWGAG